MAEEGGREGTPAGEGTPYPQDGKAGPSDTGSPEAVAVATELARLLAPALQRCGEGLFAIACAIRENAEAVQELAEATRAQGNEEGDDDLDLNLSGLPSRRG